MEKVVLLFLLDFDKAVEQVGNDHLSLDVVEHKTHITLPAGYLGKIKEAIGLLLNKELQHYSSALNGLPVAFNKGKVRLLSQVGSIVGSQVHFDVQTEFVVFRPKLDNILQGTVHKQEKGEISCLCHGFFYAYVTCSKRRSMPKIGDVILFKVTKLEEDGNGFLSIIGEYIKNLSRTGISGDLDSGIDDDHDILSKSTSSVGIPSPTSSTALGSCNVEQQDTSNVFAEKEEDRKAKNKKKKSKHKKKSKTSKEGSRDEQSRDHSTNDPSHCNMSVFSVTGSKNVDQVQDSDKAAANTVSYVPMQISDEILTQGTTERMSDGGIVPARYPTDVLSDKIISDSQTSDDIDALLSFKKNKKYESASSETFLNENVMNNSLLSNTMDISYAVGHSTSAPIFQSGESPNKSNRVNSLPVSFDQINSFSSKDVENVTKHQKKEKKLKKKRQDKNNSINKLLALPNKDEISSFPLHDGVFNFACKVEDSAPASFSRSECQGPDEVCDRYQALLGSHGLSKKEKKIIKCLLQEKKKKLKKKKKHKVKRENNQSVSGLKEKKSLKIKRTSS